MDFMVAMVAASFGYYEKARGAHGAPGGVVSKGAYWNLEKSAAKTRVTGNSVPYFTNST
jgi:hypothetical protein